MGRWGRHEAEREAGRAKSPLSQAAPPLSQAAPPQRRQGAGRARARPASGMTVRPGMSASAATARDAACCMGRVSAVAPRATRPRPWSSSGSSLVQHRQQRSSSSPCPCRSSRSCRCCSQAQGQGSCWVALGGPGPSLPYFHLGWSVGLHGLAGPAGLVGPAGPAPWSIPSTLPALQSVPGTSAWDGSFLPFGMASSPYGLPADAAAGLWHWQQPDDPASFAATVLTGGELPGQQQQQQATAPDSGTDWGGSVTYALPIVVENDSSTEPGAEPALRPVSSQNVSSQKVARTSIESYPQHDQHVQSPARVPLRKGLPGPPRGMSTSPFTCVIAQLLFTQQQLRTSIYNGYWLVRGLHSSS